jgi:cytochrome c biogenesis protein CcdA
VVTSVLVAILTLAAVDSVNPASITGAIYLAGSGETARLRMFVLAVFSTYLLLGLALTLGPAAALRSALGAASTTLFRPAVQVAAGGVLVGIGIRSWRQSRFSRPGTAPATRGHSGLTLGVVATLADLPTAGPLLIASALVAGTHANVWAQAAALGLYDLVYVLPLIAVALARRSGGRPSGATPRRRNGLVARANALAALSVTVGALIVCEGMLALLRPTSHWH